MLIHKGRKKIILNSRNRKKLLTLIPHAKTLEYKGKELVVIHHGVDETRILRNLGYDVPAPVELYYDWPGRYKPFHAQLEAVKFSTMHERLFNLSSMGTGKSMAALWSADYLMREGLVKKALIVAPLSTLERTWADSIFASFPERTFAVLHGTREKRLRLLEEDVDFYIINSDGVKIIEPAMKHRPDIDLIVVDELAVFRNASTDRWKALNSIVNKGPKRRVFGMTGTPIPTSPTDAWAQCRLVSPSAVPQYFGRFRDMVMRQVSQWKFMPKDNALEVVHGVMQPAIRFSLSDCVDLPPQIYETREAELSSEQKAAYLDMKSKLHAEIGSGQVTAVNEAVKISKLLQIACGMAIDNSGQPIQLDVSPRLSVVEEVVESSEGKVIVFVPFTGALEMVAQHLSKRWSVEIVNGETKKSDRDRIFGSFQKGRDPHVIVANSGTMAHGITLTAATTIIWYAPVMSNEIYEQACARAHRPGQTRTTVVVHVEGTPIEKLLYERLRTKGKTQGLLLEMYEGGGSYNT